MRLTAELLQTAAEIRLNPLGERELVLRGLGIVVLENLSAANSSSNNNDGFDTLDVSQNRLTSLSNFPRWTRLSSLNVSQNVLQQFAVTNLRQNLPHVRHINASRNPRLTTLSQLAQLVASFPQLETLSLCHCPVTHVPHYRRVVLALYMHQSQQQRQQQDKKKPQHNDASSSSHLPLSLRVLDYTKIRPKEVQEAQQWAASAQGSALLAPLLEEDNKDSEEAKTFTPGEGLMGDDDKDDTTATYAAAALNDDQKQLLKQLLENANSEQELRDIQQAVLVQGVAPETFVQNKKRASGDNDDNNEESDHKRARVLVEQE